MKWPWKISIIWDMMTSSNRKNFPRYWPFVRRIHRSPVNSPHKGGALKFTLICACINTWVNNGEAGDLRRHRAHHDAIVMNLGSSYPQQTQRTANHAPNSSVSCGDYGTPVYLFLTLNIQACSCRFVIYYFSTSIFFQTQKLPLAMSSKPKPVM